MSMLSQGPFSYNRFDIYEKKAKPDFLDMDKDGNKKESMKKAIKDKDGKCDDCGKKDCGCDDKKEKKEKGKPPWLKEADMSKAPSIKDHEAPKSTPVKYDKKMNLMAPTIKKEGVTEIEFETAAGWLIENGICKDEDGCEVWLEHATQDTLQMLASRLDENRQAAYTAGESDAKKSMKSSPAKVTGGKTYTMKGKDGKPLFKESVNKDDVLEYMLENNLANNSVPAEVLFDHNSDEFLERIEDEIMEGWKPLPKEKMARQASRAYDKENAAVRAGNEKEVNKQMQRRIAMKSPAGRRTQLGK